MAGIHVSIFRRGIPRRRRPFRINQARVFCLPFTSTTPYSISMDSLKEQAIDLISKMPDTATFDDILSELYVIEKIRKGQHAARAGDFLTEEQAREQMKSW